MKKDPNQIENQAETNKEEIHQFPDVHHEHRRKREGSSGHRRRRSKENVFKRWVSGLIPQPKNELEIRERKKEQQIEKHIRAKRRKARNERIKERIRHPFGKPKTVQEKAKDQKDRAINRHLNRKTKAIRIQQIKQRISESISAVREPEIRSKLFKIVIPSLTGFVAAYLSIYILTNITVALVSVYWNISTTINTSVINFNISPNSPLWTQESVVTIFFSPVVLSMAISFLCIWLFSRSNHQRFMTRIYLFWMILIGQAMSWGSFFGGFIRKQGVYHGITWGFHQTMFSSKMMEITFMCIAFIWLVIFGAIIKPLFIRVTPSATLIKQKYRFAYYQFLVTIPYILGIATIAGINAPVFNLYIFIQLGSMILIFFWVFFENDATSPEVYRFKVTKSKINGKIVIGLLILIIVIFKLIFDSGIYF
jgi:hypothetical protein